MPSQRHPTPSHPTPTPTGDLRSALYADVDAFVSALRGRDFLGGPSPNLADLSMFGVLRAVAGTPAYNDVVLNTKVCLGRGPGP
jgi:glutathione S-transferase